MGVGWEVGCVERSGIIGATTHNGGKKVVNLETVVAMCLPDINVPRPTNDAKLAVGEERGIEIRNGSSCISC